MAPWHAARLACYERDALRGGEARPTNARLLHRLPTPAAARKAGMTDAQFAELMAVVGMANESNRLASGYQVEIDDRFRA